ncbi:MAG: hypothetical protein GY842_13680, partial [bacterium]|nr:hypothetical protein [bacterium]
PSRGGGKTPPSTRAFTLIETVVAGTLLVGVLALLAPSLRAARNADNLAGCLANLRTIGQASLTYAAEDPDELMIPVPNIEVLPAASGDLEWGGRSGTGQRHKPSDPASSIFGTGSYRGPAHRPLNPYLYKREFVDYNPADGLPDPGPGNINYINDTQLDLSIYRCPGDTGYAGGGFMYASTANTSRNEAVFAYEGLTAYDHYGTSYSASVFWIVGGLSGQQVRSRSTYLMPLSRIPAPAHTIAYQEACSRFLWLWGSWADTQCYYSGRCNGSFNTVPGWHGMDFRFNVTFADGHSATVKMQGCTRPTPNLGEMNYPLNEYSSILTLYEWNECMTIRGPEWRLDTLPAAPVLTPFWAGKSAASPDGESPDEAPSNQRIFLP